MSSMIRKMGSFRSYVGLEEYEMKDRKVPEDSDVQPEFLPGELVISEAMKVLMFTTQAKRRGLFGSLFATNGRVIFVSSENRQIADEVPLLSMHTLWYYSDNAKGSIGKKLHRRMVKLGAGSVNNPSVIPSGSTRVIEILIACSDFRMLRFSFKFSQLDHGLRICNAIIHHSFPLQLDRLFYFDYCHGMSTQWRRSLNSSTINVPSYLEKSDWLKELNMTRSSSGYRITSANEDFNLCGSLPEWIVVPADLIDVKLVSLASKLKGNRPPFWAWSDIRGGTILRMPKLNSENDSSAENAFFEVLRKIHPKKRPPQIIDLDEELHTKEIRQSFYKLIDFCCPELLSSEFVEAMDSKFLSQMEQTKWMIHISKALTIAGFAATQILSEQDVIILQEHEARDTSCLCSSLIQIIVDERFRTTQGYFSLIQKEWIAFGHPFHSSYMHASPIFLLFLDCTHQLMRQNLAEFEFNDKLLARIWESCFDSTRGTFLFDAPQDRKKMDLWKDQSVWTVILENSDSESDFPKWSRNNPNFPLPRVFQNPLYKIKSQFYPPQQRTLQNRSVVLKCSSCMCDLTFWTNFYLSRTLNAPVSAVNVSYPFVIGADEPISPKKAATVAVTTNTPEVAYVQPLPSPNSGSKTKLWSGRDPLKELEVVESLLAIVSTSTKYRRQSPHSSRTSGAIRSAILDKGGTSQHQHGQQQQFDFRKNPFKQ